MITETRAIERHGFDAGSLRLLGDTLTHQGGGSGVATVAVQFLADFGFRRRGRSQDLGAVFREDLRVDVQVRTVHSQTGDVQFRNLQAGLTCTAQTRVIFVHDVHPYFFLVSFRITRSSA